MTKPSEQAFDPFATFVQLREGGGATALTWTPDFWRKLQTRDGERMIRLRGGQGCIVPRGVWHRLILRQPSERLFVTPPRGTQLRSVATTERA